MHSKRNDQQSKKAAYGMGENICEAYICKGVSIQIIERTHTSQ